MTQWKVASIFALLLSAAFGGDWKLGAPAPDCTVKGRSGTRLSLSQFRGRKVVLIGMDRAPEGTGAIEATVILAAGGERGKAYLIDEGGIVRRIGPAPASGEGVAAFVKEWEDGRASFLNRCARCHGEDGADDAYPYISPLAGIGGRLTMTQIRARLHPAVVGDNYILIRGEPFTARQFEALVVFIAGL